ncbi:MAG: roadblock/LC7 domain-containing protein [Methanobacteriota archaeon]
MAAADLEAEIEGERALPVGEALAQDLHASLQELQSRLPGMLGSVLVDSTGFPLSWDLKGGADPSLTATAGALVTRATRRTLQVLDFGEMRNTILTTTKGSIGVFKVTRDVNVIVMLQPSTNNIAAIVEINRAIEKLRQVMRSALE